MRLCANLSEMLEMGKRERQAWGGSVTLCPANVSLFDEVGACGPGLWAVRFKLFQVQQPALGVVQVALPREKARKEGHISRLEFFCRKDASPLLTRPNAVAGCLVELCEAALFLEG